MVGRPNVAPELDEPGPPSLAAAVTRCDIVNLVEGEDYGAVELTECCLELTRGLGK
ncbi:hypothetical protein PYH37_005957 (plasmid) [Sinorhizobium numidicum]|uniref:Uncharacterized protein n=1 Tax=Sinorhizobium numidicum TaxID=680248 RepID=A0ABY8D7D0_9HYPH|nr:hypothetical protein [Sinorhizobium numidicum]WEX79594.1 hypothetical protein PYH37_005957 [Sinorhizobium numidicum]WEX85450.1 hypothetical protein PYH38_006427 [Sinorhizobium numidicum]